MWPNGLLWALRENVLLFVTNVQNLKQRPLIKKLCQSEIELQGSENGIQFTRARELPALTFALSSTRDSLKYVNKLPTNRDLFTLVIGIKQPTRKKLILWSYVYAMHALI